MIKIRRSKEAHLNIKIDHSKRKMDFLNESVKEGNVNKIINKQKERRV